MKILAIITVTSFLVGFAVGGGDTIKDFEYVDDVASVIEWRVDTERRESALRPSGMTVADTSTPEEPLNMPASIKPIDFIDKHFPPPPKTTTRAASKPPICTWGFFGRLANPTNREGNCILSCGLFERKIKYKVGKKFLFFGGRDVCCCVRI